MKFYGIPGSSIRYTPHGQPTSILEAAEFDHSGCLDPEELCATGLISENAALAINAQLTEIADRPGSGVRTISDKDVDAEVKARLEADMRTAAESAHRRMVAAGEKTA